MWMQENDSFTVNRHLNEERVVNFTVGRFLGLIDMICRIFSICDRVSGFLGGAEAVFFVRLLLLHFCKICYFYQCFDPE